MKPTVFKDAQDRPWDLAVTFADVRRVRDMTGVDLNEALRGELLVRMAEDIYTLVGVLWAIVQPQAEKAGVSLDDFERGLAGQAIEDATRAFMEGLTGFFGRPDQRQALRAVIQKLDHTLVAAGRETLARIDRIDPENIVARALETSSGPSGTPPESAGSIPTLSPSESCSPCVKGETAPSGPDTPSFSP